MALRKRVRRFRRITFKFTDQQKRKVDAYCRKNDTTPIRMYKKAIMLYLFNNGYSSNLPHETEVNKNQMSIFDFIEEPVNQQEFQ